MEDYIKVVNIEGYAKSSYSDEIKKINFNTYLIIFTFKISILDNVNFFASYYLTLYLAPCYS